MTIRSTDQREAILRVLREAEGPLLPEEILRRAQRYCGSLGQATVYRTLKRLARAGDVETLEVGDRRARYETTRPHHHHFVCRRCDGVFDLPGCVRAPRSLRANLPRGFMLDDHELLLYGRCADCA